MLLVLSGFQRKGSKAPKELPKHLHKSKTVKSPNGFGILHAGLTRPQQGIWEYTIYRD